MKTFSQIIDEGYTYPTGISEDLQAVIYDWYQDRYVADDTKFPLWFSRALKNNYERYEQLLRIEPGIAEYDWLVTEYQELQRQNTGSSTDTTTISKEGTNDLTRNVTGSKTDTGRDTRAITASGTNTTSNDRTDSRTVNRDDSVITTGTGSTTGDTEVTSKGDDKTLVRMLPMQQIPVPAGQPTSFNVSDAVFDWATASEQQGIGHENTTNTDESTSITSRDETNTDSDITESSTSSTDIAGTNSSQQSITDTHEFSDATTSRLVDTGATAESTEGTKEHSDEGLTREIRTGRNGEVSAILERAKKFISSTNAWDWLTTKIEPTFMGVYEI